MSNSMGPIHVVRERGGLGDIICIFAALDGLAEQDWARPIIYHGPKRYELLVMDHCFAMQRHGCGYEYTDDWALRAPNVGIGPIGRIGPITELPNVIDLNCPAKRHEQETGGAPTVHRAALFCAAAGVDVRRPRLRPGAPIEWTNTITIFPTSAGSCRSLPAAAVEELASRLMPLARVKVCADTNGWRWRTLIKEVAGSRLVISVDSGPFHLAGALNRPVLGLFGPTDGELVSSIYPTARYVQGPWIGGCQCPCYHCFGRGFGREECGLPGCASMAGIEATPIVEAARQMLGTDSKSRKAERCESPS